MIFTPIFYRKAGWLTCFSIFLLVLAGGIVRATVSGMGCPDWPTCFGTYIPPTSEQQLPEDYQEIYLKKRLAKIDKYVKVLNSFGFHSQADKIANDPDIKKADRFSVVTTWIEALNRYLGALTGLFALTAFISSFQFVKRQTSIFLITGFGILAVLINAWMGSVVVATNLMQGPITIHYLAAFLAAGLFMWPVIEKDTQYDISKKVKSFLYALFALVLVQSITGTWSRETVDIISKQNQLVNSDGHLNYSAMGMLFIIHRYLSVLVLLLVYLFLREVKIKQMQGWAKVLLAIIISQIIAGSINILWVLPPFAQVFHIFGGGLIFGISMYLLFKALKTNVA
jgi:cytochrome c oxidase assembly protein subunit 15